ncbi:MAG TPA: metallophosphoesterase [Noviherbaspirillum sp.]|nr:metallophosphoesterase [Noviherbaspirillum sp.]
MEFPNAQQRISSMPDIFEPRLDKIAINQHGRDFAVGDIHGCFNALRRALDHIRFDPTVDRLFARGDLVDRGPESQDVTTWLDYPWFHAICGNHEQMIWRSVLNRPYPGVNHLDHGGAWFCWLDVAERERIASRLMALPIIVEIETPAGAVGLIHADCPCDDWSGIRAADWRRAGEDHWMVNCCLWSIDRYQRRYAGPVRNIRAVVHGHMTVRDVEVLGNVYYIDTGGWKTTGGRFSFLNLHTLQWMHGPGAHIVAIPRRDR